MKVNKKLEIDLLAHINKIEVEIENLNKKKEIIKQIISEGTEETVYPKPSHTTTKNGKTRRVTMKEHIFNVLKEEGSMNITNLMKTLINRRIIEGTKRFSTVYHALHKNSSTFKKESDGKWIVKVSKIRLKKSGPKKGSKQGKRGPYKKRPKQVVENDSAEKNLNIILRKGTKGTKEIVENL